MLQTFEEIQLEDRRLPFSSASTKNNDESAMKNKSDKSAKDDNNENKTVNVEKKSGQNVVLIVVRKITNCPSKKKSRKCFEYGEYGYIASDCPSKQQITVNNCTITYP